VVTGYIGGTGWWTAKILLGLASTVILRSESHGTHDHTLLPDGSVSLQSLSLSGEEDTKLYFSVLSFLLL
jgi:hypothetical protein